MPAHQRSPSGELDLSNLRAATLRRVTGTYRLDSGAWIQGQSCDDKLSRKAFDKEMVRAFSLLCQPTAKLGAKTDSWQATLIGRGATAIALTFIPMIDRELNGMKDASKMIIGFVKMALKTSGNERRDHILPSPTGEFLLKIRILWDDAAHSQDRGPGTETKKGWLSNRIGRMAKSREEGTTEEPAERVSDPSGLTPSELARGSGLRLKGEPLHLPAPPPEKRPYKKRKPVTEASKAEDEKKQRSVVGFADELQSTLQIKEKISELKWQIEQLRGHEFGDDTVAANVYDRVSWLIAVFEPTVIYKGIASYLIFKQDGRFEVRAKGSDDSLYLGREFPAITLDFAK